MFSWKFAKLLRSTILKNLCERLFLQFLELVKWITESLDYFVPSFDGTVMQIEKALINDRLRLSEVSENFEFQLVIMLL